MRMRVEVALEGCSAGKTKVSLSSLMLSIILRQGGVKHPADRSLSL